MAKAIDLILLIGHLTLAIIIFILTVVSYVKLSNPTYEFINDLGENWSEGPIMSIIPRDYRCNIGEDVVIQDQWPGTVEGCDCSGTFHLFGSPLARGACSRSRRSSQRYCADVRAIPPINYTSWSEKMLCGKRLSDNYFELEIAANEAGCSQGTRSCGIADTKNNVLCIPNDQQCPINKLEILQANQTIPTDFNYKSYPLGNEKTLIYTNENTSGEIIHEFKVGQNTPCINTAYYDLVRPPYILSNEYGKENCPMLPSGKREDTRVNFVDSDSLNEFYYENHINQILRTLPLYQAPPDSLLINLYEKEYYGLSINCRHEINSNTGSENFLNNLGNLDIYVQKTQSWSIAAFVVTLISMIFFIVFFVIIIISPYHNGLQINLGFEIAYFVFCLLNLIILALYAAKGNSLPKDYLILTNDGCGDDTTDEVVTNFAKTYGTAVTINDVNAFLAGLLLLFPIGFIFAGMVDRKEN